MTVGHKDAEWKPRAGEQMFQAVFMAMEEGAVLLNRSGEIAAANPAAENILGLAATELVGRSFADFAQAFNFINEDETPFPREQHPAMLALQTGKPQRNVLMGAHRPDGRRVWLSVNVQPLASDGGSVPEVLVKTFHDITEHKRTEDALRFVAQRGWLGSAENFFDALAQYLGKTLGVEHVVIAELDRGSTVHQTVTVYAKGVLFRNQRCNLKGSPCASVVGQGFRFYPRGVQQMFPDDRALGEIGVNGYAGLPLWDSTGQPIGLIAVMDSKPLRDEAQIFRILQIMATRTAAEFERKRNDRVLRQSELEFRTLAESIPDNILRYDRQCRVRYMNPALRTSIAPEMMPGMGKTLTETFPGNDAVIGYQRQLEQVMLTGEVGELEFDLPNPQGEMRTHHLRFVAERDDNGEIVGVLSIGRDITERKRMEQAVAAREQEYRCLMESSPDFIIRYDLEGRIRYLNSGLRTFLGMEEREIIGRHPREIWPDGRYAAIEHAVVWAVETGAIEIAEFNDVGATDALRFHQVRVVPERDASGTIVGTIAFGQEITGIREAERKLKHYVESLPGFAFTFSMSSDGHASFPYASPGIAELYGLRPEDVKDDFMPIHMLAHPDDRPRIEAAIAESAQAMTPLRIESRICRPGLIERWQEIRSVPERETDGSIIWYGIMLDITERKQAEQYEQFRSHILELLSGNASLVDILEGIVRGVELLNPEMICSILLLDSQGKRLGEGVAPSLPDFYNAAIDGMEIGIGAGCCGTAAASGERVIAEDIQTHPYWASYKELTARAGLGACWSEPIRSSSGRILGTFAIYHREANVPTAFDIAIVEKTAHLVSIAIERRQAEEALRASEERMRLFFERQLVGMAITSPDKGWIKANDKICEMLGYPREELVQMSWAEVTHPDDLGPDVAQFEQMLKGEIDSYSVEKRYIRKDGGIVHAALSIGCVRKADGVLDYVLALIEDVTERKLTELERQASAHSLECMDRVNKAILGAADQEQMMSDVLDVVLDIFGCDRAFLLHPCDPDALEWHVPMERTRPEYPGALSLGGAIPMDGEAAGMLRSLLHAGGVVKFGPGAEQPLPQGVAERFDIKSMMSMAVFPKLGKPWQFGIHQCCHARRWTHDEELLFEKIGWRLSDALTSLLMYRNLQASEREFRTLAENLPDILVRYDREGRRTYVNPALEQVSVTAEQVIGKTLLESNPSGMRMPEIYWSALRHTLATGERSVFEIYFAPPDGKMRTHLCFIAAERAADGTITGAISVGRDITERKRNEAELEHHRHHLEKLVEERTHALSIAKETAEAATRAKTHFLAAASHDLRQPLQAIRLFNDALSMTGMDAQQKRINHSLSKAVNSLSELLNGLLDISRLDAGIIEPQFVAIRAEDVLGMVGVEFDAVAREKKLGLRLFCPLQDLTLFSDENLLMALLRNLVSNAMKYTVRGGVLVGIRRRGDRALVQVWDTGIGIAPEQTESIFEEYFQIGNPARDRAKGVGLGLSIVKRLSKLLDIGVSVRSCEGKGSVFELSVPLAKKANESALKKSVSVSAETGASVPLVGKRIVVIEDDAITADAIKLSLEGMGAQITLFNTAEDALASAEAIRADCYISDYRLPGMNGLQLLDAIQAHSAKPIRAVLLTGNTLPDQLAMMPSSPCTVLFKPIDLGKLLAAMDMQTLPE